MITVHHLENSRSQRILWLLEELDIDYEVKIYPRDTKTSLAPKELLDVHPLGKSPVITDEQTVIAESAFIVEYLIEKYGQGKLAPAKNSSEMMEYRYWLHHAEGSAMPPLVMRLIFTRIKEQKLPIIVKQIANSIADTVLKSYIDPNIAREIAFWEASLEETGWFAGDTLSGADIMMSFPIEGVAARVGLGSKFQNLKNFLEKIHSMPTYQNALAKGGKYDFV